MTDTNDRRLVTFLGTGDYQSARYDWPGLGTAEPTSYICAALARLWQPVRIHVLATPGARQHHEAGLIQALSAAGAPAPDFCDIRSGRSEPGLWQQFQTLIGLLGNEQDRSNGCEVLLDITHGLRAQPFFAGAVIGLLQAIGRRPDELSVVYAELRRDEELSPVWRLDLFINLLEWSQALRLFLDTGVAGPVVDLGRRAQRQESERIRAAGKREFPQFSKLVKAIEDFSDDLATIRVAAVITGYAQDDTRKTGAVGSARRLLNTIDACQREVSDKLPPLALILNRLSETVRPLAAERLAGGDGQSAMLALARRYLDLGRFPEAAVVLREARVSRHGADRRAVEINSPEFDEDQRKAANRRFGLYDPDARTIADLRNDIEHGGFRRQPQAAKALKQRIDKLIEAPAAGEVDPERSQVPPARIILVSRHPGARDWLEKQGLKFDRQFEHLEPAAIQPRDAVIGTFPIHLAAALCDRGARVIFLSLDLPPDLRGRELEADQLAACNPRLEEFQVKRLGVFATARHSA
ncbi:MAG: CRISPR-associated protein Csx16 [Xanthomonadales bacterium]|nr:CRISPR-associated protein Csx16 [Xanthomonadales bacterium]